MEKIWKQSVICVYSPLSIVKRKCLTSCLNWLIDRKHCCNEGNVNGSNGKDSKTHSNEIEIEKVKQYNSYTLKCIALGKV